MKYTYSVSINSVEDLEFDEEKVVRLVHLRNKMQQRLNGLKLALWNNTRVTLNQIIDCRESLEDLDNEIASLTNTLILL